MAHHAAHGLDAQRQRHHVEQQHVPPPARQRVRLDGGADRDDLVRIDVGQRRTAEKSAYPLANQRHTRRAADQYDLFDIAGLEAGIGQRLSARRERARYSLLDRSIHLTASDTARDGYPSIRHADRKHGFVRGTQFAFGPLRGLHGGVQDMRVASKFGG